MTILSVKTIVGEVCMTREDGQKLHDHYRGLLDAGEMVKLDFAGTTTFVSAFFNTAVGQLLRDYTRDQLKTRLLFANVPAAATRPLQRSIEQAERYYSDSNYRATLERVQAEQSELV
ncbi:STAS-like domain-containing protein [Geminisphaera colitermitum]|uniref:STAS-like domain-containing protein n=1 Tax=Geminisphaera colitermitum TaxID=1148786 RepID=UPI000158CD59|nr:STAS-like domain-containing protein [Geminisphaera colitermitum]